MPSDAAKPGNLAGSNQRTALVVGASGFLGGHLTARLLRDGWRVFDLRFAGRSPKHVLDGVQVLTASGASTAEIAAALPEAAIDRVFHVAAAGVRPGERDLDTLLQANVLLPQAVLRALEGRLTERGGGRFILTGSCAEYGPVRGDAPLTEYDPAMPLDVYGASKAAGTAWTIAVAQQCKVPAVVLRIFHIFGPNEAPHRLVTALFTNLRTGHAVPLSGGDQVRDLLYVDDVVDGLLAAGDVPPGRVYNLCSSKAVTVREVAQTAAAALGKPESLLRFGELPYRPGELMWLVGNNRRFVEASNWRPRWTLQAALAAMAAAQSALAGGQHER